MTRLPIHALALLAAIVASLSTGATLRCTLAADGCAADAPKHSWPHVFFSWPRGAYGRTPEPKVPQGTSCSGPPRGMIFGYYPPTWQPWPGAMPYCEPNAPRMPEEIRPYEAPATAPESTSQYYRDNFQATVRPAAPPIPTARNARRQPNEPASQPIAGALQAAPRAPYRQAARRVPVQAEMTDEAVTLLPPIERTEPTLATPEITIARKAQPATSPAATPGTSNVRPMISEPSLAAQAVDVPSAVAVEPSSQVNQVRKRTTAPRLRPTTGATPAVASRGPDAAVQAMRPSSQPDSAPAIERFESQPLAMRRPTAPAWPAAPPVASEPMQPEAEEIEAAEQPLSLSPGDDLQLSDEGRPADETLSQVDSQPSAVVQRAPDDEPQPSDTSREQPREEIVQPETVPRFAFPFEAAQSQTPGATDETTRPSGARPNPLRISAGDDRSQPETRLALRTNPLRSEPTAPGDKQIATDSTADAAKGTRSPQPGAMAETANPALRQPSAARSQEELLRPRPLDANQPIMVTSKNPLRSLR